MKFLQGFTILYLMVAGSLSATLQVNPKTRLGATLNVKTPIDTNNKYHLGWSVDERKEEITFEIEAETKGYIGFGISPNGAMTEADLFIAGVFDNGTAYSGDYHGTRNGMPTLDEQQDWVLIDAIENNTHTILKFSRKLDTCDDQDFPINGDTSRVIWSLGVSDVLEYHAERGTVSANFLIPEPPFNPSDYQNFTTVVNMEMPAQHTSYWCSLHKGPTFDQKQHVVGFEASLPSAEAVEYTHHFILYRCTAPADQDPDQFFQQYVESEGGHCYGDSKDVPFFPYCAKDVIFVWSKGGKRMFFPVNVGFPIGEKAGEAQYYMLEIHYDNPKVAANITFSTGLTTFHTPNLRNIEAGLMVVGHRTNPSLVVPPQTKDFIVTGHCSPECTRTHFPSEGITVFNSLLHAHLSGRQLKTRHFRNGEELPWLDYDGHYDFNFQQNKPLNVFVKVLPGDQLTYECVYDSTWNEKKEAVVGGLSSRNEMCEGFFWYYPKMNMTTCSSSYPVGRGYADFGITEYHEVVEGGLDTIMIDAPEALKGTYVDAISFKTNWTEAYLEEFQEKRRYAEHEFSCAGGIKGIVKYPDVRQEYIRKDKCKDTTTTADTTNPADTTTTTGNSIGTTSRDNSDSAS